MEIYIVRRGDTIFNIAKKYGLTAQNLARYNQLSDPSRLPIGLALVIPSNLKPAKSIEVNGYAYSNIPEETLTDTLRYLTFLSPFSWQTDENGSISPPKDQKLIAASYSDAAAPLMTVTNIKPDSGFSSDIAHAVLTNDTVQNKFIDNILSSLKQRMYYGLNLDFEYIYPFDRGSYNQFLRRLSEKLHNSGYYFITAVAPKTSGDQSGILYEAHDYSAHGKYADRVIIMTYEWGYTYSSPQAVSPASSIRHVLDYAVTQIPAGKILMGYSNYGYNWTLPWKQGNAAKVISNSSAVNLASSTYAQIKYDENAQAPHFNYSDINGQAHEVWFEDPRSARSRLQLVSDYGLAGISIWTVNQLYLPGFLVFENTFETEKIV